ncbi:MAG: bifunctional oligoribonuclease/PAP phosphatase NrnA [Bacteroidetes bacterium]|nr:bifunctional oligoribonuclease/PAP phosphatase NrnA [Bacteroidota bacterium]
MKSTQLKDLESFLKTKRNIVIVTHWTPDGDAMGSSLGLYNFLIQLKHRVTVITPNDYPQFLFWLPGNKKVLVFSEKTGQVKKAVAKADLIFCLDFNSLKRIDKLGDEVAVSKAKKMIIDHHLQPDGFADFMLHDVGSSSTAQLVYELICALNLKKLINKAVANCLYTGIMTDTGSFRFPSTSAKTLRIAADLVEAGASNSEAYNNVYDNNSGDRVKLLGYCLGEKLKIFPEYKTAMISLSAEELTRYNYQKGDTEGVINYGLSIRGIRFAAFFADRDDMIKVSFRSKGSFDVNKFARMHFEGGGHANAAGGMSKLTLDQTIDKFLALLPAYTKQLNSAK